MSANCPGSFLGNGTISVSALHDMRPSGLKRTHKRRNYVFIHFPPGHEVEGLEFIATSPDQSMQDNLLSLPECT
jgi:hypothetical protein